MASPVYEAPRAWANGDTLTQGRAQAYLADNYDTGPHATTVSLLNDQFGPNGPGIGARGLITVLDANSIFWSVPLWLYGSGSVPLEWRSDWHSISHSGTTADTGTSYTITDRGPLMPYKALLAAGLNLHIDLLAQINAGASSTEFAGVLCTYGSVGGALTDYTTNATAEVSTTNTSAELNTTSASALVSGAVTAIGTADYVALALGNKHSGSNTGNIRSGSSAAYSWHGSYIA